MLRKLSIPGRALTAALLLSALAGRAEAFGGLILIDKPPAQDYSLSIGPGVAGYPESPGSSRTKVVPIPGVDFYWSLGAFASTDIGLGWNFSRREDLQFGVRLWPVFDRDDKCSQQLGLSNVGTRLGKGLFLNYAPLRFLDPAKQRTRRLRIQRRWRAGGGRRHHRRPDRRPSIARRDARRDLGQRPLPSQLLRRQA
jgi:hypothetical protein